METDALLNELLATCRTHQKRQIGGGRMYEIPIFRIKVFKESTLLMERKSIQSPEEAANAFRVFFGELAVEHLAVICLSAQNDFLGILEVARGTVDSVSADRGYVANLVTSVRGTRGWIIIHNHFSTNIVVSREDRDLFRAMAKLGHNIDRPLVDAVILSSNSTQVYSHATAAPYEFVVRE